MEMSLKLYINKSPTSLHCLSVCFMNKIQIPRQIKIVNRRKIGDFRDWFGVEGTDGCVSWKTEGYMSSERRKRREFHSLELSDK